MLLVRYDRAAGTYHITRTIAGRSDVCDVVPTTELQDYLRRKRLSLATFMAGFHTHCWPGTCPQCL